MKPRRPGPLRWLWYALGGGLPLRYREWVLHDASRDRWVLRHFLRAAVQISLVSIPILLLVPGPMWVRLSALLLGALVGLQYALWFVDGSVERRIRKAGYPPGAAQAARDALHAEERAAAAARYAARYQSGNAR
ncbi:hypothetical protein GCM10023321_14860 [Pseudonocardia eucalypti]|uniref:DUF5313 domain-containing protein n=1 Tax=Pseudonocardia eucalypti TaxID=648755 RepID=A0ABP9PS41_9PSEU|nr:hypothetical protein [Pseudonocardia eucalypti]